MTDEIPLVNWPEPDDEVSYKVCQFYSGDTPYLRFGRHPFRDSHHTHIVEDFAREIGVECVQGKPLGSVETVPMLPDGCGYRMCGAGFSGYFPEQKTAAFHGMSVTYKKMEIDRKHILRLAERFPEWQFEFR